MKKFMFAAITLMVLAGSTFIVPAVNAGSPETHAAATKTTAKPDMIPPPTCPIDDPNGCGIFG
jgi:hypothetical protein